MPKTDEEVFSLLQSMRDETRTEALSDMMLKEMELLRGIYDMGFTDGYEMAGMDHVDEMIPPEGYVLGLPA